MVVNNREIKVAHKGNQGKGGESLQTKSKELVIHDIPVFALISYGRA